jgi:hypothetical protein
MAAAKLKGYILVADAEDDLRRSAESWKTALGSQKN